MNPEPKQPAESETNKETHKIDPNIVKEKIPETPKTLTPQLIEKLYKMLETEVTKEELKDFGISNNINANELSEFMKTNIKDFKVVRINNKYKLNREHEKTI
jgi:translation initiation factor 2 beta subunit (eIF-2beta)/eIF-5